MSRTLILFDLTRLLSATGRAAPTGIERVEYQYARWLSALGDVDVEFVATVASAVRHVPKSSVLAFLDRQARTWSDGAEGFSAQTAIDNVNAFLRGEHAPRPHKLAHLSPEERRQRERGDGYEGSPFASWARQMAAAWAHDKLEPVLRTARGRRPIIYLRASHDKLERPGPFDALKAQGVKIVIVAHDTIPIDFPEFVRPKAAHQCQERVTNMARLADGIVCVSHYCAGRLRPHLQPFNPRLVVAHPGTEDVAIISAAPGMADIPYFLMVSTIEARKNHTLVLNLWRRMIAELGPKTPKLIIAGKRGWEAQTPIAMLDRAADLSPHVYEAGAAPDAAIKALRQHATAVLMPSFVEGFGLPVTEALAEDTPVIASDIPAFREIAGDACEFIDPLDGPAWRTAIDAFAKPQSPRKHAAIGRAKRYNPPTWAAHFRHVRTLLDEIAAQSPALIRSHARRVLGSAALMGRSGGQLISTARPTGARLDRNH